MPLPQYLTSLGDLYNAMGDTANAKKQLDLVLYIYQVFQAGGVNVDMEKSAYLADHANSDNDLKEAVTLAERAAEREAGRPHDGRSRLGLLQGRALPGRIAG